MEAIDFVFVQMFVRVRQSVFVRKARVGGGWGRRGDERHILVENGDRGVEWAAA